MLKSQMVAPHIPFLRRYARALTGSQGTGDAYVAAALEALVKEPALLGAAASPRIALFRLLSATWNAAPVEGMPDRVLNAMPAEKHLGHMTPKLRQAFLLVSVEGFSNDEAATILDIDGASVRDLVEEAGRELAAQIATDVLIIEDEPLIALDLEDLVEALGHRVIGIARTRSDALAIARSRRPGLILADIQLADGSSGLEAVNDLLATFQVPVIFITAFPERFLTGERPEPAFLVSKPFQPKTISALVSQALFFERNAMRGQRKAAG